MLPWQVSRMFLGSPISVLEARRFVTTFLAVWPALDDAVLIVSELATNAIRHTHSGRPGGRFVVSLEVLGFTLHLAVQDEGGPCRPRLFQQCTTGLNGRGLALVSELSSKWGVTGDENGRTVWAVLDGTPLPLVRS